MNDMTVAPFSSDPIGWIIWIVGAVFTLWTFYFAIRSLVSPGERNPDHPKRLILKDDR
jgi:hypothetical protein